ncbi:1,2-phenylacetyl-CoA epoxidase subunit PaaD [Natronocalculus amylovorans]|uniref:Metal-sulfur cluster assembly factor n=1 Tax=Natronocalculus amylovorans TaxID=2917812 RepID=A0AAE3K8K0_9EURY|nr:1,2-phenylacetyl-CoA epoxidase subunit PaaD [Natronocalculus amylovorans]MCL9817106.1 metal-sulfur cluster assembly factor [Natronocalculus amylovorans]
MSSDRQKPPAGSPACGYTDYTEGATPEAFPKTGEGATGIERAVWDALYAVDDPEMPVSVVDLGLIYNVFVEPIDTTDRSQNAPSNRAVIEMTLTYSGCPARELLTNDVKCAAETVPEIADAEIRLRYSPPWNVNMVTDDGRTALRKFGLSV